MTAPADTAGTRPAGSDPAGSVHAQAVRARAAASELATLTRTRKDAALHAMADALEKHSPEVLAANAADLALIRDCTAFAVGAALRGESGVVGHDEGRGGELRAIEFDRIAGGKAFDSSAPWFTELLGDIGQA